MRPSIRTIAFLPLLSIALLMVSGAGRPARAWVTADDPSVQYIAVAADSRGNAVAAGSASPSFDSSSIYVVKLAPTGFRLWQASEPGGTFEHPASARAVQVDRTGDVYVTGTAAGEFLVLKYAGDTGSLVWRAVIQPPAQGQNSTGGAGEALAIDRSGDIVAGGFVTVGDVPYAAVARLDPASGAPRWEWTGDTGSVRALAIDRSGHVAITGPFLAAKLDGGTGNERWKVERSRTRIGNRGIPLMGTIGVDTQGDVVAGGTLRNPTEDTRTFYVAALNGRTGAVRWEYAGPARPTFDSAAALVVEPNGGVYAAGPVRGIPSAVRLRRNGAASWVRKPWREGEAAQFTPGVTALALAGSRVAVTGSDLQERFKVTLLNPSGSPAWARDLGAGRAVAIAAGGQGRLFVVGRLAGTDGQVHPVVVGLRASDGGQLPGPKR